MPLRLIHRAAEIERERQAAARLTTLQDAVIGTGLAQGKEYVDPGNRGDVDTSKPHYTFRPLQRHQDALDRLARPWAFTEADITARREAQEDAMFNDMFTVIAGLPA